MSIAVYKDGSVPIKGAEHFIWEGLHLAMKVVQEAEVEAHRLEGWVLHPYDTVVVPEQAQGDSTETPPAANPFKK